MANLLIILGSTQTLNMVTSWGKDLFMVSTIFVKKILSSNPPFRKSADVLFEHISKLTSDEVLVDFSDVGSVTRSFIHQYTLNKGKSSKKNH